MTDQSGIPDVVPAIHAHLREAARLRELASAATTSALKERLLEKARYHEQIATGRSGPTLAS